MDFYFYPLPPFMNSEKEVLVKVEENFRELCPYYFFTQALKASLLFPFPALTWPAQDSCSDRKDGPERHTLVCTTPTGPPPSSTCFVLQTLSIPPKHWACTGPSACLQGRLPWEQGKCRLPDQASQGRTQPEKNFANGPWKTLPSLSTSVNFRGSRCGVPKRGSLWNLNTQCKFPGSIDRELSMLPVY